MLLFQGALAFKLATNSTVRLVIPVMKNKMAKSNVFYRRMETNNKPGREKAVGVGVFSRLFAEMDGVDYFHRIANVYYEEKKNFAKG